jgi:hypothetical protein
MCYPNTVLSKNKEKRLAAIKRVLDRLIAEKERIDKNIIRLRAEEERIREAMWAGREDVPIAELLDNGYNQTKTQRQLLDAWLKRYYLRTSGYSPDTLQSVPQIMLYSKDPDAVLVKLAEGITALLPVLKPIKETGHDQGINLFDIFEHTLSQYGSWTLARDVASGVWHVRRNRFDERMYAKLEDALRSIRERHYYQKGERPKEFQATA